MKDYKDKVVVITGAAGGIGGELARRFGAKGAKLSLADIDEANLSIVTKELKEKGFEVISSVMDVSILEDVQKLADRTFAEYGTVDYLFNHAGTSTGGTVSEAYLKDYDWVMAVNTMSLVYAAKVFVNRMVEQDKECHIINTLSVLAFFTFETSQPYAASKYAALALTEALEWQMRQEKTKVKVHALCPGFVASRFGEIELHRPPQYALDEEGIAFKNTGAQQKSFKVSKRLVESGISVEECVDIVFKGLEEERFTIFTHPEIIDFLKKWRTNLLDGKPGYTDGNVLDMAQVIGNSKK